jgi:hypothetical protein
VLFFFATGVRFLSVAKTAEISQPLLALAFWRSLDPSSIAALPFLPSL